MLIQSRSRIPAISAFILLLSVMVSQHLFSQTSVNIPGGGNGPAPGVAFNYRPLGTFWGYDRSQIQLSAAELGAAAVPNGIAISAVSFYLTSFSAPTPSTPVRVLLKEVAGPAGLAVNTYAGASTGAVLCFNGTVSAATFTAGSWVTIPLTTPFYFNGGGTHLEILVETNYGGGGGEAFNGKVFSRSNAPGNLYQYWAADNTPPVGNGVLSVSRPDVQLTYTVATPCSGVPPGITANASPGSVCSGVPYTISVGGLYPPYNSGYTFQWLSSTVGAGGPFTAIPGATQAIYACPGQIAATWYQCQVRCNNGPPVLTTTAAVGMNAASTCYCNSSATSGFDTDIGQVNFGALTNPAATGPVTNNATSVNLYTNYTATVPAQNYVQGTTYPISLYQITSGNFFFAAYFNVFIDYNQDGSFDPVTERVFSGGPTGPTSATPVTTSVSGSITIPFSSQTGVTRMRVVLREGGNNTNPPCGTYTWGETEDYNINIVPGPPCSLNNAGNATSSLTNVCPTVPFSLGINGTVTLGSGMSWQWQSGPSAAGPWTNIAGATYYPFSTTQSATTWYRCQVACGANSLFTTPVQVVLNTPAQCYCVPVHIPNCNNMWTSNVTLATLNNTTGCSSNTGLAYNVYPALGSTTTTVTQNQVYNLSVTTSGIVNAIISVWIDFNYNGVYEPTEWQQVAVSNPPNSTATIPISIPGTSGTGLTGMRVRSRFSGNPNGPSDACLTFGSGETEDYLITINPFIPPVCNGIPGPFNSFISQATACSGTLINLTLNPNSNTVFAGLTYQWQSAPAAAGPWVNIAGATNKFYSFNATQTEWYRCIIICTNTGQTSNSTPVSLTIQPTTWLGFTDDWNDPTNWCGRVPTLSDDVQISLLASGRPAAQYFFPVVAVGDTMRARNLTVASTDSVTVRTDTTVYMSIAQNVNNNGRFNISSTSGDSLTFGASSTNSGLIQIFRGGTTPDNIVQVIYTISELQAAGMLAGDLIDSMYFKFFLRASTAAYQNFSIAYMFLPPGQDQFTANDPLLGVIPVYSQPALIVTAPVNGVYTALTPTSGILKLPLSNFKWDGTSNVLIQVCYDMTAGSPGGSDLMYLSSTAPRKSCLWLGSTSIATSGCALTTTSPGLIANFGQVPSTLRPNIAFRFRRPQNRLSGTIGGDFNNNAGARWWASFAGLGINGNLNNANQVLVDTCILSLSGNFVNTGSFDFGYTPLFSQRKSQFNFSGNAWQNNGAFTAANSLVSFDGNLNQTLGGTSTTAFHEWRINKPVVTQNVTMLLNASVSDTLTLAGGLLLLNNNTLSVLNPGLCGGLWTAPSGPITRTAGFIISESATSVVKWTIGSNSGFRSIPFGSASTAPVFIPFSFTHNSGDLGQVSVSTYKTPANNLPLPPTVTHLNIFSAAASNANQTVDRFWITDKTGLNPNTSLTFRFATSERPSLMSTLNPGRAQPWRTANSGSYNAWLRITNAAGVPVGSTLGTTVSYTQTYTQIAASAVDSVRVVGWDWPSIPAGAAPFFAPAGPIGNFLPWTISNNNSPLPVELLHFDARAVGEDVRLDWSTASETNSDYYIVERTVDFTTHTEVARIPAAGLSTDTRYYHALDRNPYDGINYYRLMQVDRDGVVNLAADYIPVRFGTDLNFEIRYITSAPDYIMVFDYNAEEPLDYALMDVSGRIITARRDVSAAPGVNFLPLDLSELAAGVYTVRLNNRGASAVYRFVQK